MNIILPYTESASGLEAKQNIKLDDNEWSSWDEESLVKIISKGQTSKV